MSSRRVVRGGLACLVTAAILLIGPARSASSQNFDFAKLRQKLDSSAVVIDMKVEISFGAHMIEQQGRYLGTIITSDGLVMFNGADLQVEGAVGGLSFSADPVSIEVTTLGGEHFQAEFVGTDRYTRLGFLRLQAADRTFTPLQFAPSANLSVGSWVGLFMLLPDFISPSLAGDVGMVSALVESPEHFPLTVGFGTVQLGSVLFSEQMEAVGVLGLLHDPSGGSMDESALGSDLPLLGVITPDRIARLAANPPTRGKTERGWLGIRMQALTSDMSDYWGLAVDGGVIVSEIVKGSPAEAGGLKVADIIVAVDGRPLQINREENLLVFQRAIADMTPGSTVEFSVLRRDGAEFMPATVTVGLTKAPLTAADSPKFEDKNLEFTVRDLVFDDYLMSNQDPETFHGVFVSKLEPGGLAEVGGLQFGDIIQRISGQAVTSVDEAKAALQEIQTARPREVIFFIWRDNKTLFVNVKTDWQ